MTKASDRRVATRKERGGMSATDVAEVEAYAATYHGMTGAALVLTPAKYDLLQANGVDMGNFVCTQPIPVN